MSLRCAIALSALLLAPLGCDRRVEPYVPPEQEPPPPERPVRIPGLSRPQPRVESLEARTPGAAISGEVRLADGVASTGEGVLFVIARSPAGGPPLAVKRLPPGPFPMAFSLGPDDAMIRERPFAGPMLLTARLDQDGDPMTRGDGDPSAAHDALVEPGTAGIELILE